MGRTRRDVWWHEVVDRQPAEHEALAFDAEHPLYIMYTSGTTAKPKGILHTSGGYLTHVAATHSLIFDLKPEKDVFWTAADIGWVTGHSYIVYGPLANAATSVMYEGTPDTPTRDRWWDIVERYKVNILYCRSHRHSHLHEVGRGHPRQVRPVQPAAAGFGGRAHQPGGLHLVPPEHRRGRCPVVDTWWQTNGRDDDQPAAGSHRHQAGRGHAAVPRGQRRPTWIDNEGRSVGNGEGGFLVINEPWPGMLRTICGRRRALPETYWSRFRGRVLRRATGPRRTQDGDLWLLGRVDDVMNVSGHPISTTEVEHALVGHPWVAEAAVVGRQ